MHSIHRNHPNASYCHSFLRPGPSPGARVAILASNSSSRHNSSSSISDGFNRPPTFIARSRSSFFAWVAACSRSSAKSSVLSPENSFKEIRKSRRITLNRVRSELVAKSPSMKELIWGLLQLALLQRKEKRVNLRLQIGKCRSKEVTNKVSQELAIGSACRSHVRGGIDRSLQFIGVDKPEHLCQEHGL
jgi:hypothetical protein